MHRLESAVFSKRPKRLFVSLVQHKTLGKKLTTFVSCCFVAFKSTRTNSEIHALKNSFVCVLCENLFEAVDNSGKLRYGCIQQIDATRATSLSLCCRSTVNSTCANNSVTNKYFDVTGR